MSPYRKSAYHRPGDRAPGICESYRKRRGERAFKAGNPERPKMSDGFADMRALDGVVWSASQKAFTGGILPCLSLQVSISAHSVSA
jgi:hypothetical protein